METLVDIAIFLSDPELLFITARAISSQGFSRFINYFG